mmetsp:Transcript_54190/g.86150  ORF Transcript_54190/g.86150 Transcript_54190/m.86150 type:complete len:189 (-) Transcript_54190:204-770(-)
MILPMPSFPMRSEPSDYAKRMSKVMLFLLSLQTVTCVCRMVMLLDIMGGFIQAIGIGLGWYAWKENMDLRFICYWGMLSLFNGAFDLVKLIDALVKSPSPLFSSQASAAYNIAGVVQLAVPLSGLAGAILAWQLYKDATSTSYEEDSGGSSYMARAPPGRSSETTSLRTSRQPQVSVFAGSGNRLGSV